MSQLLFLRPVIWLLASAILFYLFFFLPAWDRQEGLLQEIAGIRADLLELEQKRDAWQGIRETSDWPPELTWNAQTKDEAELGLQDQLVKLGQAKGLTFFSFGSASAHADAGKDTVAVSLEGTATLSGFYSFLAAAEQMNPRVAFSLLRLRPGQNYGAEENGLVVDFQLIAWSFWEKDDA